MTSSSNVSTASGVHPQYLPLPDFFNQETASRVGDIWMVPYQERFEQALRWRKKWDVKNAALDKLQIAVVGIDMQITFIQEAAQLVVGGAVEDARRFAEFIYRNLPYLTRLYMTLDTHTAWQIFHQVFLVDENGNYPTAGVPIPNDEIQSGRWRINPEAAYAVFGAADKYSELLQHLPHYSRSLADAGDQYPLIPWPFHSLLGSVSHALMPVVEEAVFFHNIVRGSQTRFEIKGGNPLSEAYSPYGEEVKTDHRGRPIGQKNEQLFNKLHTYDAVIIAGEAKSHCVRAFIADHLKFVLAQDRELAKKIYLVEDLTSPVVIPGVVDFTEEADKAFDDFRDAGMNIVQSTTPLHEWPGLEDRIAEATV